MKTKDKETLKDLAQAYLIEIEPAKKFGILLKVESLLQGYTYTSKAKLLKDLEVSYFSAVNSSQKIEKEKRKTSIRLSYIWPRVRMLALRYVNLLPRVAV